MALVLAGLLLLVAELAVVVEVARQIGVLTAVVLLVAVSALGPWLVRRVGFGVWRRAAERLDAGELPGREAVDGLLLLAAGVLICVPGFITDAVGILLLAPPVRALLRGVAGRRLARRVRTFAGPGAGPWPPGAGSGVVDAASHRAPGGTGADGSTVGELRPPGGAEPGAGR